MNQTRQLILFTLKEVTAERAYQIIFASLLIMPWLLLIPASLFMLDIGKVYTDFLFAGLHIVLLIYIFFLVTPLVARDIEHSCCQLFLTLPMSRSFYIFARYAGIITSIIPLLLAYLTSSYFAYLLAESIWPGYVYSGSGFYFTLGSLLITLPYLALVSVLFLIASRATGLPEITVFLFSVWLLCWTLPPVLSALSHSEVMNKTPDWIAVLLNSVNQLLPDLSSSEISLHLAHTQLIDPLSILAYSAQHIAYALLIIMLAAALFKHRDLA